MGPFQNESADGSEAVGGRSIGAWGVEIQVVARDSGWSVESKC